LALTKRRSGDDYASAAKPQIDWDDQATREALIDSRAKDGLSLLAHLDDRSLEGPLAEAAKLLSTVVGQDLEEGDDGVFRIARRVAKDRVISTVDPEARHARKTSARGFDGCKAAIALDPDSEIITDTEVSPANAGDASVAADLTDDLSGQEPGEGDHDDQSGDLAEGESDIPGEPISKAGPSRSAATRASWPKLGQTPRTRSGVTTTGLPGPKSSASLPT
jgi:hypothetical protein